MFTNQQAVMLCHKFCLDTFLDITPAKWRLGAGCETCTRSAARDMLISSAAATK